MRWWVLVIVALVVAAAVSGVLALLGWWEPLFR
jgi:hypothetical protein